jgi:hypothetical protein
MTNNIGEIYRLWEILPDIDPRKEVCRDLLREEYQQCWELENKWAKRLDRTGILHSIRNCQEFANQLCGDLPYPIILESRETYSYYVRNTHLCLGIIRLAMPTPMIEFLHELTHHIVVITNGVKDHGDVFCGTFEKLLKKVYSPSLYSLKRRYKKWL